MPTSDAMHTDEWPDDSTTGPPAGTTFTVHDGDLTVTTAGEVIEGVHVQNGTILCRAANVTIRNSKITGGGILAYTSCTGLRVDHIEVDCDNHVGSSGFAQDSGFVGQDIVLRNVNVHRCENGVFIDNGVDVYDSYIHEPITPGDTETGAHSDGIQLWAGASDLTIEGNVIDYRGDTTSAIISCCGGADIVINRNKLMGGAYALYLPNQGGRTGPLTNVRVTNNRFITGAFGYCTGWVDELTEWAGNVEDATGAAIPEC